MELTKRTKIIGGVMVVGLAALGYDRLSGGPERAAAAPQVPGPVAASGGLPSAPAAHPAAEQGASSGALADRLGQLRTAAASDSRQDAFVAPVAWFPPPAVVEKEKAENKPIDVSKYKLSTVIGSKDGKGPSMAVVNGHTLIAGEKGWAEGAESIQLIEASQQRGTARVRINGQELELRLPGRE